MERGWKRCEDRWRDTFVRKRGRRVANHRNWRAERRPRVFGREPKGLRFSARHPLRGNPVILRRAKGPVSKDRGSLRGF